jgi:hypothetical protein
MRRIAATLPEGVEELALIRIGLIGRSWRGRLFVARLARQVERHLAASKPPGLLSSERFAMGRGHVGWWQYWDGFDRLEAWARQTPHSEWWRTALDRIRRRDDVGLYHETFLVRPGDLESLAINAPGVGLSAFGVVGEPVGLATTGRDRLGRRKVDPGPVGG